MQLNKPIWLLFLWLVVLDSTACVDPILVSRSYDALGVVRNSNGDIVYEEHHSHQAGQDGGGTNVKYLASDGTLIARKLVDYDCRASAPNYQLEMLGKYTWAEKVHWKSGDLVVTDSAGNEVVDVIQATDLIIDAGFNNYIIENWASLIAGEVKEISFLHVPARQLVRMTVSRTNRPVTKDNQLAADTIFFQIIIKNRLFRLFSEPVQLKYDRESKQLLYYSGPTNLRGKINGLEKSSRITIHYTYMPDMTERFTLARQQPSVQQSATTNTPNG